MTFTTTRNGACKRAGRSRGGFTLVETLVALLILVIMSGIVVMGIPTAFRTYTKAVDGSNAQVLLSTTTSELRNELGLAQDAREEGGTLYYMTGDGYWASLENTADGIEKHVYLGIEPGGTEAENSPVLLVSKSAQTDTLRIKFDGITYSDGVFTVSGLQVVRASDASDVLVGVGDDSSGAYQVRAIMLGEGR